MLLFISLFFLWVILNGKLNTEIVLFGIVLSALICLFCSRFIGSGEDRKKRSLKWYGWHTVYFFVLFWEIVKANMTVLKIVFSGRLNFNPVLVYFDTDLREDRSRVILANSITLTPGTVTVILENGQYCVHCLDGSLAEGIENSVFVRLLERMEAC